MVRDAGQPDPIRFKLKMTRHFLSKIPSKIPKSTAGHARLEVNSEMFLFFAASVVEMLKRKINDEFEIFDKQNVFYIHGLRKSLASSGRQGKTKRLISKYFTTPRHTTSKTETENSTLWILQSLRNQAMHGNIIDIHNDTILFSYTIREGKRAYHFQQKSQNPQKYFGKIFAGLDRFNAEITSILT